MKLLTPVDQLFLFMESRTQPMHVAGLQLFSLPPGEDSSYVRVLADQVRESANVQPPFNHRLKLQFGQYTWQEDRLFDPEYHVRYEALPQPGRIRDLLTLVSAEHSHHLDRQRPLWQWHLIENIEGGRVAIYTKIHHAMMDGISAMRLVERSMSTDPARRGMPPVWANPPSGPMTRGAPTAWLQALIPLINASGKQIAAVPTVARELMKTVYRASRHPHYRSLFQAPRSVLNGSITGARRFAAQDFPMQRLQVLHKSLGATINDLVLAMCAGALRRYLADLNALPKRALVAMVPMSLRHDNSAEGNQVGVILCSLATDQSDPERRLRAIQASIQEGKARFASMSAEEILNYTALSLTPAAVNLMTGLAPGWQTFNLVISNVPGPRQTLYWNGLRLEGLYPASIAMQRLALNITVTSYDESLSFGLIGCRETLPHLQRLLIYLEQSLVELESVAGAPLQTQ